MACIAVDECVQGDGLIINDVGQRPCAHIAPGDADVACVVAQG